MFQINNYSEKLKDPRWQKKRLKIFERDNWACRLCKSTENTLVVHHKLYLPNTEPWDYNDQYLTTLCENCHEYETANMEIAKEVLCQSLRRYYFSHGLLVIGLLIDTNLDYYQQNPKLNGRHKGSIQTQDNKLISKNEYTLQSLREKELTTHNLKVMCESTIPSLIKLIYTPNIEVLNGKTN